MANKLQPAVAYLRTSSAAMLVLTRTAISVSEQPLRLTPDVQGLPSWASITTKP